MRRIIFISILSTLILGSCREKYVDNKVGYIYYENNIEEVYFREKKDSFIIHFFSSENSYFHKISKRVNDTVFFESEPHINPEMNYFYYKRNDKVKNKAMLVFPEIKKYYICFVADTNMIFHYDFIAYSDY